MMVRSCGGFPPAHTTNSFPENRVSFVTRLPKLELLTKEGKKCRIMFFFQIHLKFSDLVKFFMCALVSRVHMTFYILIKMYTVLGNQGIHDELNQRQNSFI